MLRQLPAAWRSPPRFDAVVTVRSCKQVCGLKQVRSIANLPMWCGWCRLGLFFEMLIEERTYFGEVFLAFRSIGSEQVLGV
jgi:hypothetical protein